MTPQEKAVMQIICAVADAIRDLGTVPSGHLYARLMDKLSLRDYERIIDQLKSAGLVEEKSYELRWVDKRSAKR